MKIVKINLLCIYNDCYFLSELNSFIKSAVKILVGSAKSIIPTNTTIPDKILPIYIQQL